MEIGILKTIGQVGIGYGTLISAFIENFDTEPRLKDRADFGDRLLSSLAKAFTDPQSKTIVVGAMTAFYGHMLFASDYSFDYGQAMDVARNRVLRFLDFRNLAAIHREFLAREAEFVGLWEVALDHAASRAKHPGVQIEIFMTAIAQTIEMLEGSLSVSQAA